MKTKKAFTLVELLVVIAILAILATATIVGFTAFTQKAKLSNLEGELKQVTELLQLEDYYNDHFEISNGKIYNTDTKENADDEVANLSTLLSSCSDPELRERASRLSYVTEGTVNYVQLTGDDGLWARWNVKTGEITSGKTN